MSAVNPIVPPIPPVPPNPPENPPAGPHDPRWFWISLAQYLVLGLLGAFFAYFLVNGVLGSDGKNMERLANPEIARGVITYLVAVATVAIATMLVMAAILRGGTDLDKRFAFGKEILSL